MPCYSFLGHFYTKLLSLYRMLLFFPSRKQYLQCRPIPRRGQTSHNLRYCSGLRSCRPSDLTISMHAPSPRYCNLCSSFRQLIALSSALSVRSRIAGSLYYIAVPCMSAREMLILSYLVCLLVWPTSPVSFALFTPANFRDSDFFQGFAIPPDIYTYTIRFKSFIGIARPGPSPS